LPREDGRVFTGYCARILFLRFAWRCISARRGGGGHHAESRRRDCRCRAGTGVKTQQPEFKARKRSLAAKRGRRQVIAPAPSHRGCVRRRCRCEPNRAAERRRRTVVQEPHPPRVCPLMRDPNTVRSVHCASPDFRCAGGGAGMTACRRASEGTRFESPI
jgi:hypothetical protein